MDAGRTFSLAEGGPAFHAPEHTELRGTVARMFQLHGHEV